MSEACKLCVKTSDTNSRERGVAGGAGSLFLATSRLGCSIQFADPDIAETERFALVPVGLEFDGSAGKRLVEGFSDVQRLTLQFEVVLHEDSVDEDGHVGRSLERAVRVKGGRRPHDVVGLPFARLAVRIYERRGLFIDAAGLSVHVG